MKPRPMAARRWVALCLGAALAWPALAQQQRLDDAEQPAPPPGQVLSDAEPLPAEHRESVGGALILQQSPVRAQQQQLRESGERTGIPSAIGRNVSRILDRARDGDPMREAEAPQLPR